MAHTAAAVASVVAVDEVGAAEPTDNLVDGWVVAAAAVEAEVGVEGAAAGGAAVAVTVAIAGAAVVAAGGAVVAGTVVAVAKLFAGTVSLM